MSIISKIGVGVDKTRENNNLSQDTHTTAEVGYMQPTFCRTLVGKTHVKINAKSLVRLSPLAVPTMGRISLRHYFSFIDMATLWTPFEALRTGNNYTYADGTTQTPYRIPYFDIWSMLNRGFADDTLQNAAHPLGEFHKILYVSLYKNGTIVTGANFKTEYETNILPNVGTNNYWFPFQATYFKQLAASRAIKVLARTSSSITTGNAEDFTLSIPVVTNKNADFSFKCVNGSDVYMFLGRFLPLGKRLRKMFIGCGYSFNPYDEQETTPLKLFAVYKSWYDKFAVQRTMNFNNTRCYKVMKMLSETPPISRDMPGIFDTTSGYSDFVGLEFIKFLVDLANICYVLPPDYFSASDITSTRGAAGTETAGGMNLQSTGLLNIGSEQNKTVVTSAPNTGEITSTLAGSTRLDAMGIQMLNRVLRFVNKRSVVGRKVSELLKLDNESDTHNNAHELVHQMGSSRVDINISDVMSLADTSSASLGDYAGRGIGFKDSDTFVYDTPCYGILLCLSAIVPTSGYFQGILKENKDSLRFDLFTDDYDALGYQSLAVNELVSDYQFVKGDVYQGSNPLGTSFGFMGLVPRYQHLKIGRNLCNGDISVPSMQPVMLPYNIDRHFVTCVPNTANNYDFQQVSLPNISPEVFREVKADSGYGDYNRIFQYVGDDYDHFIIHIVFDCPIISPMKSIRNSYDTFNEDDNKSLEFAHE